MAKVQATELRSGVLILREGRLLRIVRASHVHVGGRGGAYMQVDARDIERGDKSGFRLRTDEKIERPVVEQRKARFLYHEGESSVFMDEENYDQFPLAQSMIDGGRDYLPPDTTVAISFHEGRAIGVALPASVALKIVETEPQVKGATATATYKPATLETGAQVMVPPFIQNGETIRVSTANGEYQERA